MRVQVKLFFHLRKDRIQDVELADGSDAGDLIRQLSIRLEDGTILTTPTGCSERMCPFRTRRVEATIGQQPRGWDFTLAPGVRRRTCAYS